MILEIVAIQLLFAAFGAVLLAIFRHKLLDMMAEAIELRFVEWFSSEENQKSVAANVQNLVVEPLKMAALGQLGGISKGIHAQLRAAENNLVAEGIDAAIGIPGIGEYAAGYLKKYPYLKAMIPVLMAQKQQKSGGLP